MRFSGKIQQRSDTMQYNNILASLRLLATCLVLIELPLTNGQQLFAEPTGIEAKILQSGLGTCPIAADRENAVSELSGDARNIISEILSRCGGPEWRRVVFINMTDTSYDCPSGFELTSFSRRTCGPPSTVSGPGCYSATFSVDSTQYSKVCGRIIGYTFAQTCAFFENIVYNRNIESYYVDGASLTHGAAGQRQHIWTFASAVSEANTGYSDNHYCPCASTRPLSSPPFVGNDYFCESGRNTPYVGPNWYVFHPDDPIWDGKNCTSDSSCCEFSNPPWFTKELPNPTTDDIELRLCSRERDIWALDITPIELIELYVQ